MSAARGAERARYAALFAAESRALLASAIDGLARLERAVADGAPPNEASDAVDAVFRAVHSLKGMAGAMELGSAESLAHELETVLARIRAGTLVADSALVDALVAAADALDAAIDTAVAGGEADVVDAVSALRALGGPSATTTIARPTHVVIDALPGTVVVTLRLAADTPLPGVRALLVARRLEALGTIELAHPPVAALCDDGFDGSLALRLRTTASRADVERAARAAGDVAELRVDTPAAPRAASTERTVTRAAHVRVDRARLDALLDVTGELALARARLAAATAHISDPAVSAAVAEVTRLVATLHEEVRSARTAPAAEVFERLPRVVREVARAVGKRAELVLEGGDVALDRAVLEEMNEPLVHLLRNAVDHGLESPDERRALGKPATGRIVLRAARERDAVLVSVHDDGRGIDGQRVVARAAAAGAPVPAALDDAALLALLARPGFTTASEVGSVSGRGVGVDAVQDRLRRVGGALELSTVAGAGSCFTMRLPLTLSLGRALVARVGGEVYALPVTNVCETAEVVASDLEMVGDRETVRIRGESLPVVRLGRALGVASAAAAASNESPHAVPGAMLEVAVLEAAGRRAVVLVDAIDGQQDLVVKRLPPVRGAYRVFGGATILADGTPALVLDAPALLHRTLA